MDQKLIFPDNISVESIMIIIIKTLMGNSIPKLNYLTQNVYD